MAAWAEREMLRIQSLSDQCLLNEVHDAMNGISYSWNTIHKRLRQREINYTLFREWTSLCDIRRAWEKHPALCRNRDPFDTFGIISHLSANNLWKSGSYRSLLTNLKLIPLRGLGEEGIPLVRTNIDDPRGTTLGDLWIDCNKWELGYLDRRWVEDSWANEEEPLLGGVAGKSRTLSWWKWLSVHRR